MVALLRRTLDPRITLDGPGRRRLRPVQADPTLLSQALMNLCLNARDAMPDGGTLTLAAEPVEVTEAGRRRARPARPAPGRFVRLERGRHRHAA